MENGYSSPDKTVKGECEIIMKINAIVYKSNTGHTKQYAEMLAEKTGLPIYTLPEAEKQLYPNDSIIYLGWLMAGKVQGYSDAEKRYDITAVCGVGKGAQGSQVDDIRKANKISENTPVFNMQGGFDLNKLHGVYKMMMSVMVKTVGKSLREKSDRTPDEDITLEMMTNGGNYVSEENLSEVLRWYESVGEK